jgi:hypothetical protein
LSIPTSVKDQSRIREGYEEICIAHYTLFCQLAGAHHQMKQAVEALQIGERERHFLFWEACDNFYQHLQNAIYMMYHLHWADC